MFTLKVESLTGSIIELTNVESDYQVVSIEGLNPPQASITSSPVAGMDGSKFKSSKLVERNIVITMRVNGDVERNRINLYKCFRTKQWCKIYYANGSRNVFIEGYVETMECNLFSASEIMQISIICHDPYFKGMEEIVEDISKVIDNFAFPFAFGDGVDTDDPIEFSIYDYERLTDIYNEGETDIGFEIDITFVDEVEDPKVQNTFTGEWFQIEGVYNVGDKIVVNTNKGYKSVVLIREGEETNLFNRLTLGSTWLQLRVGANQFTCMANRGDQFMRVIYRHRNSYEGV